MGSCRGNRSLYDLVSMVEILLEWNRKPIPDVQITVGPMRNSSGIASCKYIETGTPVYDCQKHASHRLSRQSPLRIIESLMNESQVAWLDEARSRDSVAIEPVM